MAKKASDPTEAIRLKASQYPDVDKGTACTQTSFKAFDKGFLYIGEQGGRSKAMFKLKASLVEANKLWVKWLDERYALSVAGGAVETK